MDEPGNVSARDSGPSMRWEDGVVYALILAGIYLLVGVLFFYAGKEKIIDGHGAPPPIAKQLAIFTFSILAMGQNVTGENSGAAELFVYAAATGVLIGLVLLMPPYRSANWISHARRDEG